MWQPQEDNTYNDLRENSIRQWLEDMSRHEDVAVRGGVKVTAEYLEDLKKQIRQLEEKCEEDEREGGTVRDHCPVFL